MKVNQNKKKSENNSIIEDLIFFPVIFICIYMIAIHNPWKESLETTEINLYMELLVRCWPLFYSQLNSGCLL